VTTEMNLLCSSFYQKHTALASQESLSHKLLSFMALHTGSNWNHTSKYAKALSGQNWSTNKRLFTF